MYFVDRDNIEAKLKYIEQNLLTFNETDEWKTRLAQLGLERIVHGIIEAMIDVGNAMIDGFIMRDPGSYEDIIDILYDETVITEQEADKLKAVVAFRKRLVRSYIALELEEMKTLMENNRTAIEAFPAKIRRYLHEELGPVSAFLPDGKEKE